MVSFRSWQAARFDRAKTPMPEGRELHLKFESKLDSVDAAELIVERLAEDFGFAADVVDHLGLAVRESMINAVVHGNRYSSEKTVRLSVVVDSDRITVTIGDQGAGFDPDRVPDPLTADNLLKDSGRGLLLIRSFVDEVNIRRLTPAGTEVELIKYSSQGEGQREG